MKTMIVALMLVGCSGGVEIGTAPDVEPEEFEVRDSMSLFPYSEGAEAVAVCPEESDLVFGECFTGGPASLEVWADEQASNGWRCMAFNTSDKGGRITAVATCR